MRYLISNEIIKLYKSKSYLKQLLFILLPVLFISIMEIYLTVYQKASGDFLSIQRTALSFSSAVIFPFAVGIFFTDSISSEIKLKTNKLLYGSKYSIDNIYLAKFVATSVIVVVNFILAMLLVFTILSIYTDTNNISIGYFNVEYSYAVFKSVLIWTINLFYFISLGSLSMLLILFTKNKYTAILIVVFIIAMLTIIPLPDSVSSNSLLIPVGSFELFSKFEINAFDVLKPILTSLIYSTVFLISGLFISLRKKIF